MNMYNPAHPGMILRDCLGEHSITEVAQHLGITRVRLSRILNGKTAINADIAVRLSLLLPNTQAEFWLQMQSNYDLWLAQQKPSPHVIPLDMVFA